MTNSLGHKTACKLSPIVVEVVEARAGTTKYEYDGRTLKRTKTTSPDGAETTIQYDEKGNAIKVVRTDGGELVVDYDATNRPIRAVDPIGSEWHWGYDAVGRLIGTVNPAGQRAQFQWDQFGPVALTDAAGQHTRLTYDALGNLTSLNTPDGRTTTWARDRLGRLRLESDVNGNVQRRLRDSLGRLVRREDPDGNVLRLSRDGEGNVLTVRARHHDVRLEYRGTNRLVARSEAGKRIEFEYDTEEQLLTIRNEHASAFRFVMDACGDVAEEYGFDALRREYQRDIAGRVSVVKRPSGRETTYTYDALATANDIQLDLRTRWTGFGVATNVAGRHPLSLAA